MADIEFPLVDLPPKAQKNVLRTMDYRQLIGFSLCSKSTRQQVRSLKYRARKMTLGWARWTELFVVHIYYQNHVECFEVVFENPHNIRIIGTNPNNQLRNHGEEGGYERVDFEMNDWICHIASMFDLKIIDAVLVYGDQMPVEAMRRAIGSFKFNYLNIACVNQEFAEGLLPVLVPRNEIAGMRGSFQCGSKVLLQNLKVLHVAQCQDWKLNDLLMMNAKYAYLYNVTLTSIDLNRFLKLWMRGSNPQLVYFECKGEVRNFHEDEVMRGTNHLETPDGTTREFEKHTLDSRVERQEVRGGFDIRRYDGTPATIFFQTANCFNFVVWQ